MATVLNILHDKIPGFRQLTTNSPRGTLAGLLCLSTVMLALPFWRLRGKRILHVHSASGKSFVRKSMIICWGHFLGYKIVLHWHGGEGKEYFRRIGHPKARRVLKLCSSIIVLSKQWQQYFEDTFHLGITHVLYNPMVKPAKAPMPPLQEPLKLLFLGQFVDRKGIFDLLDVMARNQERWRGRVYLSAGGDGEIERFHQEAAEHGISDMVECIGWVNGEKKEQAFATHHILILPSYYEGLPMSVLEGLAHGKPIISTHVGGIPEAVDPHVNGFLVTPGNRQELSQAIDCYLMNPDLIERHGRASAIKSHIFSPEEITEKLVGIYQSIQ